MERDRVIAIDGPSGSGKSTLARLLAEKMNILYIDTGAMFRALGLKAFEDNIDLSDEQAMEHFLEGLHLKYFGLPEHLIEINGDDFSQKIREHHVSKLASEISQIPSVRDFLLNFQRTLPSQGICVMEGRDIGTVVFPNAFCKIFITASVDIRTERRFNQLEQLGKVPSSLEDIKQDVMERDRQDKERPIAPLRQADDAEFLDSGLYSQEDTLRTLIQIVQNKATEVGFDLCGS